MSKPTNFALYRKYRSLKFSDIVGQSHITDSLTNSLKSGNVTHAYLFTGPKGVGKTSVARILAHELNGFDYQTEDNYIDIIEIDAASNRRIDEIRDLLEKAYILPVSAKYKVYIIDEAHMLTKEAFNALLKTLEEPPAHVIFILATTELHKLPQTIVSRTQKHTFKPIGISDVVDYLMLIAKKESIQIDQPALVLIAEHSEGSLRDALSLLQQVSNIDIKELTADDVQNLLGLATPKVIDQLFENTIKSKPRELIDQLKDIKSSGVQIQQLVTQIITSIQRKPNYFEHLDLVQQLIKVNSSSNPALSLELVLLDTATKSNQAAQLSQPVEKTKITAKITPNVEEIPDKPAEEPVLDIKASGKLDGQTWANVITLVKKENNAIASILRSSKPNINDNNIVLHLKFKLHLNKLEDPKTKNIIANAIEQASGKKYTISSKVDKGNFDEEVAAKPKLEEELSATDNIINTFGGGERISM